ncbi:MAG: DUF4837 family protein [Rikenellaceae bacterium]|nr:DUF4837 family protein [Rikenellaceae bacterium]
MKKLIEITTLCLTFLAVWSCGSGNGTYRPPSIGTPYEVLIICSQDKWEGQLGDTIREVMGQPVEFINATEPAFDMMRILPNSFTDLLRKTRLVLNVVTGPEYPEPAMGAQFDVYSSPQLMVTVSGPDQETLAFYISDNREELRAVFENAERDWTLDLNKRYGDKAISKEIYDKFGVNIDLPKGYKIRNTVEDFMWISFEYPTASQGVVIYSYPYSGSEDFTPEWLLYRRNQFVSLIPGENPGSHMVTFDGLMPVVKYFTLGSTGRSWAEMRGFWDVKGDYMGGPFVSYSTVDREQGRVVTFDFYVYSPDKPKRNFLRQLENLVYGITFPEDMAAGEQ